MHGLGCRVSHVFSVLSHEPDTQHPRSFCQHTAFTGLSCSPSTESVADPKSYVFTVRSMPPEKHLHSTRRRQRQHAAGPSAAEGQYRVWSAPQHVSSTAALCAYVALRVLTSTSYMRTSARGHGTSQLAGRAAHRPRARQTRSRLTRIPRRDQEQVVLGCKLDSRDAVLRAICELRLRRHLSGLQGWRRERRACRVPASGSQYAGLPQHCLRVTEGARQ